MVGKFNPNSKWKLEFYIDKIKSIYISVKMSISQKKLNEFYIIKVIVIIK